MLFKRYVTFLLAIIIVLSCFGQMSVFSAGDFFKVNSMVEAEAGAIRSEIYNVNAPFASGGKYLVSKSAQIDSADNIKIDEISYLFNIEVEKEYRLFMRIYVPSTSATSFYYRWDNDDWKTFSGTNQDDFYWAEIDKTRLKQGVHKLQLCHKHAGVYYDLVYLTDNVAEDFVPENPVGVEAMPEKVSDIEYDQLQIKECIVSGNGAVFEAEHASLESGMATTPAQGVSNGSSVRCGISVSDRTKPASGTKGSLEFTFTPEEAGKYIVWARVLIPSGSSDSFYVAVNDNEYSTFYLTINPEYAWLMLSSDIKAEAGEDVTVRIRPRESNWHIDQFVITKKPAYLPKGVVTEVTFDNAILEPITKLPPYNPPAGEHPRVYFRNSDIPKVLENMEHPESAHAKEIFLSYVNGEVKAGENYNETILNKIEAKALYYALYGDKEKGREAVELSLQTLAWGNMENQSNNTRIYGRAIESASIIYDWCYDLMTDEERQTVIEGCIAWASRMEIGWPPNGHAGLTLVGHGAEAEILKDQLSFAIATYDERPDIWNYIGGRFYEEFVPERQWHQAAQMHHQGTNYASFRTKYSCYGYLLITGMGLPAPYDPIPLGTTAYSSKIYFRRPDGTQFLEGDVTNTTPMNYNLPGDENLFLEYAVSKDPYIKDELIRVNNSAKDSGITRGSATLGPAKWLLLYDPTGEAKSIKNLPLSYYFGSPMGVMAARTGWEEGVNSNTVVAKMDVSEFWFGNHQHRDAGNFQIYYKGPLATESGFYTSYGTLDHEAYTQQTTAHNCLIVYDPNEPVSNFNRDVNDGGQRMPGGVHHAEYEEIVKNPEEYQRAKVVGQEIDPLNKIEPDYTYLKGDLTNSYTDKVSDYKRSFMFLNLKNDDIPAALIVFDRVTTPDASLEKRWLLHGQSEPKVKGSRSEWNSNPYVDDYGYKYTGKMIVDSLLPADDKVKTEVIGGPKEGWNIINGINYPHSYVAEDYEENTYRMEKTISGVETAYFLNCIQVTEQGKTNSLKTELIENGMFYGVTIADRLVMFSKSGDRVSEGFDVSNTDGKKRKFTICDIEQGKWKITADNTEQTAYVTEEGGVLSFESAGGIIKVERIDGSKEEDIAPPALSDEKHVYIMYDGTYVGLPVSPRLVNDKLIVPVSDLLVKMGITRKQEFLKETFTDEIQDIKVTLREGSDVLHKNGEAIKMVNSAFYEDGELMVELRAFVEAFNCKLYWDELYSNVFLVPGKKSVILNAEGYAKVTKLSRDEGTLDGSNTEDKIADGQISTIWSAQGEGRYVQFEFEEETILENVEIIFNPNNHRTPYFEIQISADGQNFETIYTGIGSRDIDGTQWEVFTFDKNKLIKSKYVRYVANGSDISLWNAVREMRFKVGEDLILWEDSDDYAKVYSVKHDAGEINGDNVGENLIDRNSRTYWSTFGVSRYVDLILEKTEKISGVEIAFKPETYRTAKFEIQISENGTDFISIFKGESDPSIESNKLEQFNFNDTYNAKYVRFVGNGSNISRWNDVKEIRIIKAD